MIPGSGKSPGGRNGNLLQYSCLENPRDRSYNPWGHKERDMTELWCKQNIHIFDFTRHCYVDLVNSESLSVVSDSLRFHGLYSIDSIAYCFIYAFLVIMDVLILLAIMRIVRNKKCGHPQDGPWCIPNYLESPLPQIFIVCIPL